MHLLGCLLTFFLSALLFVFMIGLHVLYRLRDFFFGSRTSQQSSRQSFSQRQTHTSPPPQKKEKVIGDDEGEYVEFEEIKQ